MPSLHKQAMDARALLKSASDEAEAKSNGRRHKKPYLRMERDTVVLWGLLHGWSDVRIGEYFYLDRNTVLSARKALDRTPPSVFRVLLLHKYLAGKRQVFKCEVCGSRMGGTERAARTHVVAHFGIGAPSIRMRGIMDEDLY